MSHSAVSAAIAKQFYAEHEIEEDGKVRGRGEEGGRGGRGRDGRDKRQGEGRGKGWEGWGGGGPEMRGRGRCVYQTV